MRPLLLAIGLAAASAAGAQRAEPQTPAYSVVEPKAPPKAKPSARKRAARANAKATAPAKPPLVAEAQTVKPNGPCVIKPVMSDQDLVNCGARLHR